MSKDSISWALIACAFFAVGEICIKNEQKIKARPTERDKKILKENEGTLCFCRNIALGSATVFLLVNFKFYEISKVTVIMSYLTLLILGAVYKYMAYSSRPRYSKSGVLIDCGKYLNMEDGIGEYFIHLTILTSGTMLLALISSYFWYLLWLAPIKAYRSIIEDGIKSDRKDILCFYRNMALGSAAVSLLVNLVFFEICKVTVIMTTLALLTLGAAYLYMAFMSRPTYSKTGALIDCGIDLNRKSGIVGYAKDLIIFTSGAMVFTSTTCYFWYLPLLVALGAWWLIWGITPRQTGEGAKEAKQILKDNKSTLHFYRNMALGSATASLLVNFIVFEIGMVTIIMSTLALVNLVAAYLFMTFMSRPKYSETGALIDCGIDLNRKSIAGYLQVLIILTSVTMLLSLVSSYFWYLFLYVPLGIWWFWCDSVI